MVRVISWPWALSFRSCSWGNPTRSSLSFDLFSTTTKPSDGAVWLVWKARRKMLFLIWNSCSCSKGITL